MELLDFDEEVDFLIMSLEAIEPLFKNTNSLIVEKIRDGEDITSIDLTHRTEFLCGLAFVICQKYIKASLGWIRVDFSTSLKLGKQFNSELSYVQIINAAANYWKHSDEWDTLSFTPAENDLFKVTSKDKHKLDPRAKKTMNTIEAVTQWTDYTCFNLLYKLTLSENYSLLNLIPILEEWRSKTLQYYRETM